MIKSERFNSISHLVGAVLALAGAVVLVVVASRGGDTHRIVSFSNYGATLILLYLSSGMVFLPSIIITRGSTRYGICSCWPATASGTVAGPPNDAGRTPPSATSSIA